MLTGSPLKTENMVYWALKTTLDIPDSLFRLAKATAAQEGRSLKSLVEEVLQEKLANGIADEPESPWMNGFGRMGHRRGKTEESKNWVMPNSDN